MEKKGGSHKNIWYGQGRQRIEIPKPVLKSKVLVKAMLNQLYVCGLGYYPKAAGIILRAKKGCRRTFFFTV